VSVETDFRALLAGHAPLLALVGSRVALNAVPEGSTFPLVVFAANHDRINGLDGTMLVDSCSIAVQCWADTAAQADAVADAVRAAVATAPAARSATVTERSTTFDPELGADGVTLTVLWWQTS
jgi:hypothetical protein